MSLRDRSADARGADDCSNKIMHGLTASRCRSGVASGRASAIALA
jgi:hypothetical protein